MELTINAKNWKLRQYRDFTVAAKEGDFDKILSLLSLIIEKWNLPGDPHDTNYYLDELDVLQWQELIAKVGEKLTEVFNSKK
jgi:hypothetical protein